METLIELPAERDNPAASPADVAHTHAVADEPLAGAGRTVVIADDDLLLREGIASLLTQVGYCIVGQAGDGTELLSLVR